MIKVTFSEPTTTTWWKPWRSRCLDATEEAIALVKGGQKIKFANLYSDRMFKQFMLESFHSKCAYCETSLASQQGDVEHFRPKGRVDDEQDKPVIVLSPTGANEKHPGYYWLAYDWTNLIPSCQICNQPSTTTDGRRIGKRNRFPIQGTRAVEPDDILANEQPLLLNPVVDDPRDHLWFDSATGLVGHKTERGEASIKIFDLNRDKYVEQRKDTYKLARQAVLDYIKYLTDGAIPQATEYQTAINSYRNGDKPYSMAARAAIDDVLSVISGM